MALTQEKGTRALVIRRVHDEARETRALDALPEGAEGGPGVEFRPGQVAVLRAGLGPPAYFAIASAPEDDELEFLVRLSEDPTARAVYSMRPGDRVGLVEIVGRGFDLAGLVGRDLVFVAMGTGVAPLRSALRSALARADRYGRIFATGKGINVSRAGLGLGIQF